MSAHADLISRLRGLSGPDRALDGDIWRTVAVGPRGFRFGAVPPLTASIDAAVALCNRVLPEWSWECRASGTGDKGQATVWNPHKMPGQNDERRVYNCPSPAIALCICILQAHPGNGGGT